MTTFPCPGCGTATPQYRFCCMSCWALLERETRAKVVETAGLSLHNRERINAREDAKAELTQALMYGRPTP